MSTLDEMLEKIAQVDEAIQSCYENKPVENWVTGDSNFRKTLVRPTEKTRLENEKAKLVESLTKELEATYLKEAIPGEFLSIEKAEFGFKIHFLGYDGNRSGVKVYEDAPHHETSVLMELHELNKKLSQDQTGPQREALKKRIETFRVIAYWPKMYVAYLRGGKDALHQFFEKDASSETREKKVSERGKLKERILQFAERDGCQQGHSVSSARIRKWVAELTREGVVTNENSIRSTLQRLGYSKEKTT